MPDDELLADPQLLRIRVISATDAKGTTFRFRSVVRDAAVREVSLRDPDEHYVTTSELSSLE